MSTAALRSTADIPNWEEMATRANVFPNQTELCSAIEMTPFHQGFAMTIPMGTDATFCKGCRDPYCPNSNAA